MAGEGTESLRDVISQAVESTPEVTPPVDTTPVAAAEPAAAEPTTDNRPRDEHGRFVKQEAGAGPEKPAQPQKDAAAQPTATPPQATKHSIPRPSSWHKDYWNYWENFDPKLAE